MLYSKGCPDYPSQPFVFAYAIVSNGIISILLEFYDIVDHPLSSEALPLSGE